jgi:hypothetical protein
VECEWIRRPGGFRIYALRVGQSFRKTHVMHPYLYIQEEHNSAFAERGIGNASRG